MGRGIAIVLGALLFLSLGVNVFALGHMSGRAIAGRNAPPAQLEDGGHRGDIEDPFKVLRYAEELSPELRQRFRDSFRAQLPQMRETHHAVSALRRELAELMIADEWDRDAIMAKLDEISAVEDRQKKAFAEAFIAVMEDLPVEQRKALFEVVRDHHERREERREKRRRHGEKHGGADFPPPPPSED